MQVRQRKLLVVLTLCSVVGLVLGMAMPVLAHAPTTNTQHGFPNENNGDGQVGAAAAGGAHQAATGDTDPGPESSEGEVVGDALDTGANFSAVTDPSATAYGWLGCAGGGVGNPTTSTPGGACDVFGVDTVAKPGVMPAGAPAANYFRLQTKIPVDYEGGPQDLYGVACASDGNPATQPTDVNHCTLNNGGSATGDAAPACSFGAGACTANMHLDHTAITTDHAATTTGRIESVKAGAVTCNSIDAHGCGVPNLQALTLTAVTGPAPNSADAVGFCVFSVGIAPFTQDTGAPAGGAPPTTGGCTVFALDGTPAAGPGGTDLWEVTIPAASLGSNTIDWVSISEHDDGSATDTVVSSGKGDCLQDTSGPPGDDCRLDAAQLTFTPSGQGATPPPPPPTTPPTPPTPPGGGGGCNRIVGNAGDNVLNGTAVCDNINGKAGDDLMRGKKGNDKIRGGGGTDIAKGGGGNDNCTAEKERSC